MLLKRPMLAAGAAIMLSLLLLPAGWLWLGAAAVCFAAFFFCGRRFRFTLLALLCVFAGSGAWGLLRAEVADSRAARFDGRTAYVEAYVCELPRKSEFGATYTLRLRSMTVDGETYETDDKAQVWLNSDFEADYYDVLKFTARVDAIPSLESDGGALYRLNASEKPHVAGKAERTPYYYCLTLKKYMLGKLAADGENERSGLLSALLLGDKSGIDADTELAFRKCGVSHLTVVSGLHVVTVTMFLFEIMRRFTKRPPVIPALILVWLLAALTAFSPSAVRAAFMLSIVLCATFFGREGDGLNSLGAAVFVMCLISPSVVRDVGFLLSVSATAGLLVIAPRIRGRMMKGMKAEERPRPVRGLIAGFSEIIAQSVAAWLATLPVTALFFGSVSLISPLANLLVLTPAALTLTLGLPAATLPWIGVGFLRVAGVGAGWLIWVTKALASLPFSYSYVAYPYFAVAALAAVAAYIAFRRGRLRGLTAVSLSLAVLLSGVCANAYAEERCVRVDSVYAGVGQADFVSCGGKRVLYVSGLPESSFPGVLNRAGYVGIISADAVVAGDLYSVRAAKRLAERLGAGAPFVPEGCAESGVAPVTSSEARLGPSSLTLVSDGGVLDMYLTCGGTLAAFTGRDRARNSPDAVFSRLGYAGAPALLVTGRPSDYGETKAAKALYSIDEGVVTLLIDNDGIRQG